MLDDDPGYRHSAQSNTGNTPMNFGWLTLALSPSPNEDAVRIDQQIEQVFVPPSPLGFSDVWLDEEHLFHRRERLHP